MDRLNWEQFVKDINVIYEISQQLNDGWNLVHVNDDIGGKYLVKSALKEVTDYTNWQLNDDENLEHDFDEECGISLDHGSYNSGQIEGEKQILKFEYHVLYHLSYAVPYLSFNAYDSNGTMLTLDNAWKIFNDVDFRAANQNNLNMTSILTQMEHPILFKPFLTLHPCRIAEILNSLPKSKNKVLSFLSTFGPSIYLVFDLRYASCI